MGMDDVKICEIDVSPEEVRMKLIDYLKPHETQALFILGNLVNHFYPSSLYVAQREEKIVGICGYWPLFQACSIFCRHAEVSRMFAQTILKHHPSVRTVLGMADMVKPAYDEFIAAGEQSLRDPENLFFELSTENFFPYISSEGILRKITENDVDAVARLQRLINKIPLEAPLTEDERRRVQMSPMTVCLEVDGKIVAVASTNGLAIQAFQILGVATDPSYRRRGYAKAVCSFLICAMRELGGRTAILFTGKENVAALHCYLSMGFHITDRYYAPWFKERVCEKRL
jgi:predicted GNAT family acetyltransferase